MQIRYKNIGNTSPFLTVCRVLPANHEKRYNNVIINLRTSYSNKIQNSHYNKATKLPVTESCAKMIKKATQFIVSVVFLFFKTYFVRFSVPGTARHKAVEYTAFVEDERWRNFGPWDMRGRTLKGTPLNRILFDRIYRDLKGFHKVDGRNLGSFHVFIMFVGFVFVAFFVAYL